MSKILKVKIRQTKTAGATHNDYPPEYNAQKINVVAYGGHEEPTPGEHYGYCIGVVSDADAPGFLASPDIVESTVDGANALGREWQPQVLSIVLPQRIVDWVKDHRQQIKDFIRNNPNHWAMQLLKVLDPDESDPAIQWSPLFDITKWL